MARPCSNCHGGLDYHSDDLCHACWHAQHDQPEFRRRRLLRPYNDSKRRAERRKEAR